MSSIITTRDGRHRCVCNWADCGALSIHFHNRNDTSQRGNHGLSCDLRGASEYQSTRRSHFFQLLGCNQQSKEKAILTVARHHFAPSVLNIFLENRMARNRPVPLTFYGTYLKGPLIAINDRRIAIFNESKNGILSPMFAYIPSYGHEHVLRDLKKQAERSSGQREVAGLLADQRSLKTPTKPITVNLDAQQLSRFDYREQCKQAQVLEEEKNDTTTLKKIKGRRMITR
jgi:hypothetical protein